MFDGGLAAARLRPTVALDYAEDDEEESRARTVLAIAVLAIIATAPLGAVLIAVMGPRLLLRDGDDQDPGGGMEGNPEGVAREGLAIVGADEGDGVHGSL